MITSFKSEHNSFHCFNVRASLLRKFFTSWDSSLFTLCQVCRRRRRRSITTSPPSSSAAEQRLRHWGVGNQVDASCSCHRITPKQAPESIWLVILRVVVRSIDREVNSWIIGTFEGFTDQLLPCLTNAMSLLHELTFQVSKNRWKAQSGATFTSRPQILFLSVCNVFCSQDEIGCGKVTMRLGSLFSRLVCSVCSPR